MNLKQIRTALATMTLPKFHVYPSLVGATTLDCIIVGQPTSILYARTYGAAEISLPVHALVSRKSEQSAQDTLDALMSLGTPTSFMDALKDLTGPWRSLSINSVGQPVATTLGQSEAIEVVFQLTIITSRSA